MEIVPTASARVVPRRLLRRAGPSASAATLILGLTGGPDDDWRRLQQSWLLASLGTEVLLLAARRALPLIVMALLRRWAHEAVARQ